MAIAQTGDLLGNETERRAAAGDLIAQRAMVAFLLVPRSVGEVTPPSRLAYAETWARIAAANGSMEDALRLVHVLALKQEYVERQVLHGTIEGVRSEALALLAIIADGPDKGMSAAALSSLCGMLAEADAADPIVRQAVDLLALGDHAAPTFAALVAALPPAPDLPRSAIDEAQRRATCFESLAAALANAHGVDRAAAHLLITGTPDYSPELLDTKDGWDSIFAAASVALGEEPAVAATAH